MTVERIARGISRIQFFIRRRERVSTGTKPGKNYPYRKIVNAHRNSKEISVLPFKSNLLQFPGSRGRIARRTDRKLAAISI